MYNRLKNEDAIEEDIRTKDIYFSTNPACLFIPAIVIAIPHQNIANTKRLFDKYRLHMKIVIENGMNIAEVLTECSTQKGIIMATRFLKMKPLITTRNINNGILYVVDGETFSRIVCPIINDEVLYSYSPIED
ncbi:MAG: hypothetical protein FWE16_00325 [Firmicutes bacterium]|nr:hypothetical protein [Bacillota bacterium]